MTETIRFQDVTADNWEAVVDLELHDHQEDFVASNCYSLAESKFNSYAVPLAIYAGDTLVGFLMYETWHAKGEPNTYFIYRFMIDRAFQNRGYGRRAMERLLRTFDQLETCRRIVICYIADNHRASRFYASLGFHEIGRADDGEMHAQRIPVSRPNN